MPSPEVVKQTLLEAGVWQLGDYVFASGKQSNNKLDIPLALEHPVAKHVLLSAMELAAVKYGPDALFGIPSGGQQIAEIMAEEMHLPLIKLAKVPAETGQKVFKFEDDRHQRLAAEASRIVGVEDVTNEFTSTVAALRLPELSERTVAIVAAWSRGETSTSQVNVPIESIVHEPIPNIISKNHSFYRYYRYIKDEADWLAWLG